MMRVALALILALSGCAMEPIPGWGAREDSHPYPPREVAELLEDFADGWGALHPDDAVEVVTALDNLDIRWRPGPFHVGTVLALGATWWPGEPGSTRGFVEVAVYGALRDTALGHELSHLALWVTTGDPDADHAGPEHAGWDASVELLIERLRR